VRSVIQTDTPFSTSTNKSVDMKVSRDSPDAIVHVRGGAMVVTEWPKAMVRSRAFPAKSPNSTALVPAFLAAAWTIVRS
jgi:hypothetical protein